MAIQIARAVFLHIPKTGGTFVTDYFKETGMDHGNKDLALRAHVHGDLLQEVLPYTQDLMFCFVRHPLTWYRSYWIHKNTLAPSRETTYIDSKVDLPFLDFLHIIQQDHPGYLTKFFSGFTGRCRFIGKMENLRDDLNTVLKYLRSPYNKEYLYKKPLSNVNPQSDQKYTIEAALAVMETEKEIVKMYDYNYLPLEIIE